MASNTTNNQSAETVASGTAAKATDFAIKAGASVAGGALIGDVIFGPVGAVIGGVIGVGAAALSTYGKGTGSHNSEDN